MKKIFGILVVILAAAFLMGCATIVSTDYETVEVDIVGSHHKSAWMQPVVAGKVITIIPHPDEYEIYVRYLDV